MRNLSALCASLIIGLAGAPALHAQDRELTPAQVRGLSETLLRDGQIAEAAILADALLVRNPDDVTALVLRAEAAFAVSDYDGAVALAARAYGATDDGPSKYIAARLAANAHAQQQQDTRAQFWLRRARQFAPTQETRDAVADDFRFLRQRNPFSYTLRFGLTPSSNINNGSETEELQLFGLPFLFSLDRAGQPIAGLEVSAGADLSYRLRRDDVSRTTLVFGVDARTYFIAPGDKDELEAERQERLDRCETSFSPADCRADVDPAAKGSDFSYGTVRLGLVHTHLLIPDGRPTTVRYTLGKTFYGGDPYTEFAEASVSQSWDISQTDRLQLTLSGRNERGLDGQEPILSYGVTGSWLHAFDSGDIGRLTLGHRTSMSDTLDSDYESIRLGGSYDFSEPFNGIFFGLDLDLEERNYDATAYNPGPRKDQSVTGRVVMRFADYEYFGFQPVLNLEATRTTSNVDLFDRQYLRVGLDLQSSF